MIPSFFQAFQVFTEASIKCDAYFQFCIDGAAEQLFAAPSAKKAIRCNCCVMLLHEQTRFYRCEVYFFCYSTLVIQG